MNGITYGTMPVGSPTGQTSGMGNYQWDMPYTQPDWWGQYSPGWYQKWGGAANPEAGMENMMQTWWRSPQIGGNIVWHPQWGWQQRSSVKDYYQNAPGQVTWEQFTDPSTWQQWAGYQMQPQMGSSWQQWYPNAVTDAQLLAQGGGQNATTMQAPGYAGTTGPGWSYQEPSWQYGQSGQLQYPQQWQTASNVLSPMAYTGMPTPQDPWYQQAKQVAGYDINNAMAQAAEQMGLSGLRYSTPMAAESQRIAGETMAKTGLEWTGREMDALEQARQRQLAATQQLTGLGSQYFQAPMQYAQATQQQAAMNQQARQNLLNTYMQEFLRQTPEASPWLQAAMNFAGISYPGAQPTTYQPSGTSQAFGSFLPMLFAFL